MVLHKALQLVKNGVATTQNVATAINDAVTKAKASTTQALADAEHKFDGDTGTTSVRKHGEVLSIKGGVSNATDLTTGNIGVVSDGAGYIEHPPCKSIEWLNIGNLHYCWWQYYCYQW